MPSVGVAKAIAKLAAQACHAAPTLDIELGDARADAQLALETRATLERAWQALAAAISNINQNGSGAIQILRGDAVEREARGASPGSATRLAGSDSESAMSDSRRARGPLRR